MRLGRVVESHDLVIHSGRMAHTGVNFHGRRLHGGTRVMIDCEKFEECIFTMRMLKNELVVVKEVQQQGYAPKTFKHSNEEVEDEENMADV